MALPPRRDLLFVGLQALLFLALAVDPTGLRWAVVDWVRGLALGLALAAVAFGVAAVLQLGTSLTPWPSPRAGGRLVTGGTYAWARHPIYASLLWFAFAVALATGSPWRLGVALALALLFWRKADYEERLLRRAYPEYEAYARRVGRWGG